MKFLTRFCTLLIIYTASMHTLVEGSQENKVFKAFLKQRIYESLRSSTGCLSGIDKNELSSLHPSGITEARRYLDGIGKDYALYEPNPAIVSSYVTFMCDSKNFGSHGVLPQLPPEHTVCFS